MKNIIAIALLCLTTYAFSQAGATDHSIDANLSFGLYSDCFRRGGICNFNQSVAETRANTKVVFNQDQTLTIQIKRAQITLEDEVKILGQEIDRNNENDGFTFLMAEILELDNEMRMALKLPEELTRLATGTYPIIVTNDYFTVTLKLI